MRIRFGSYRLDDQRFLLERDGVRVSIRPKVFDLLALLIRDRDRVVPRDELMEALWGGAAVGMGSLSGLVNELRKLLGEGGRGPSSIRTVHARGYQFVARVEAISKGDEKSGLDADEYPAGSPARPASIASFSEASRAPEALPQTLAQGLLSYLGEDVGRVDGIFEWLERIRLPDPHLMTKAGHEASLTLSQHRDFESATPAKFERLKWTPDVRESLLPVRAMRKVDASATERAKTLGDAHPGPPGESTRSA
ncbi:MAG: transcriptional regulator [Myxococcota bacterium]